MAESPRFLPEARRVHELLVRCRAFGVGRRQDHFDPLRGPTRGFTPAGRRQVQRELVWRSRCDHETPALLALLFNPLRGPFGPSNHRFRLGLSVAPPFGMECLTSLADVMAYYALC